MTDPKHPSGTDRLAEVAERLGWADEVIVVNLQGDEPMIPGSLPGRLARALDDNPRAGIATMATPIRSVEQLFTPSVVKVVTDSQGFGLYFSRAPIPWVRDGFPHGGERPKTLPRGVPFLRHLGLYAYRVGTLRKIVSHGSAVLETAESLEQLRSLWLGIPIHVTVLDEAPPHGVDTQADLERVRRAMEET
jgi:3-deoxy-manno-octulosonate cytidylyltransferase (CMP-KDO synthetase)